MFMLDYIGTIISSHEDYAEAKEYYDRLNMTEFCDPLLGNKMIKSVDIEILSKEEYETIYDMSIYKVLEQQRQEAKEYYDSLGIKVSGLN